MCCCRPAPPEWESFASLPSRSSSRKVKCAASPIPCTCQSYHADFAGQFVQPLPYRWWAGPWVAAAGVGYDPRHLLPANLFSSGNSSTWEELWRGFPCSIVCCCCSCCWWALMAAACVVAVPFCFVLTVPVVAAAAVYCLVVYSQGYCCCGIVVFWCFCCLLLSMLRRLVADVTIVLVVMSLLVAPVSFLLYRSDCSHYPSGCCSSVSTWNGHSVVTLLLIHRTL